MYMGNYRGRRFYKVGVFAGNSPVKLTLHTAGEAVRVDLNNDPTRVLTSGSNQIHIDHRAQMEIIHNQVFTNGGPIIGIGRMDQANSSFTTRLGYQVYAPHWLQLELSMDTNFDDVFVVSPTVEMISSSFMGLPSLGLGVGVPIQIQSETRVGMRTQFSAMMGPLGFVGSADLYHGEGSLSDNMRWTLMCQISL